MKMTLDYKLDHIIKFSDEVEYKGLYTWCLREFDEDGKQIGRDQIPWAWGEDFSIADLAYAINFVQETDYGASTDEESQQPPKHPVTKKEILYGRLIPKKSGPSAFTTTRYSFFGTAREITNFTIEIVEGEEEHIDVWGSPEFDYEIDFVNDTNPDNLQIYLILKPEHFRQITDLVKVNSIDQVSLHLKGVDGFYSEWSPAISTNVIKVLPSDMDELKVEFSDKNEKKIPRLGKVEEYDFSFSLKGSMHGAQSVSDDEERRYDIWDDHALRERLKELLDTVEKDDASGETIDRWEYLPLIRQFSIIYNQARSSLILAHKNDSIDELFGDLKNLIYDFREAIGQGKTDKKNASRPNRFNRSHAYLWLTRNLVDVFQTGTESPSAFPDDVYGFDNLDYVAQEYFSRQWKSSYFEKILCEAFISLEAFLFAQQIKENITNLVENRGNQFTLGSIFDELSDENIARKNNYNMDKMTKVFWKRTFTRLGQRLFFFIGLPALAAIIFYNLDNDWSDGIVGVALGLIGIYIFYHVVRFILQITFAGIRKGLGIEKKENGLEKAQKLYTQMTLTYSELSNEYPSPQRLLSRLEKDIEEGVSYRGIMFSILQRAADDKNYLWGSEAAEV
jgi:hypothetical protein